MASDMDMAADVYERRDRYDAKWVNADMVAERDFRAIDPDSGRMQQYIAAQRGEAKVEQFSLGQKGRVVAQRNPR